MDNGWFASGYFVMEQLEVSTFPRLSYCPLWEMTGAQPGLDNFGKSGEEHRVHRASVPAQAAKRLRSHFLECYSGETAVFVRTGGKFESKAGYTVDRSLFVHHYLGFKGLGGGGRMESSVTLPTAHAKASQGRPMPVVATEQRSENVHKAAAVVAFIYAAMVGVDFVPRVWKVSREDWETVCQLSQSQLRPMSLKRLGEDNYRNVVTMAVRGLIHTGKPLDGPVLDALRKGMETLDYPEERIAELIHGVPADKAEDIRKLWSKNA
ncbi:unnamed protein product [Symbiodinium sp. CCMP2592]|nr:unnamed protein product [Symbiodinium sp. CCMP2592]